MNTHKTVRDYIRTIPDFPHAGIMFRDVTTLFAANGVQWTDRESANFSVVLSPERFEQRNLSLNSEARVAEIELTMSAQFSVFDADNSEVMAETIVSVVRQMENDPRNVVGKAGEMRLTQDEMRAKLAARDVSSMGGDR